MQIFKNILLACSIAVAVSPLCLQAEDTAAQAAARAALEQKMRELKGMPPAAEFQPAPVPPSAPPSVAPPMAVPPAAPKQPTPPPMAAPGGASPDLIEQARQATRARVSELQRNSNTAIPAGHESSVAPESPIPPYVPEKTSKEEMRAKKELEATAKKEEKMSSPKPVDDSKLSAKQEKAEAKARAEAEKAAAKQAAKEAKEAKNNGGAMEPAPTFSPLQAPASSLSSSKEQQLQQLTEQYMADKISAEEYHAQRAKIIAEP